MELVRGQRLKLEALTSSNVFRTELNVSGMDHSVLRFACLLLGDNEDCVENGREVVFEGRRRSMCGSASMVVEDGRACIEIDLNRIPASVARVVLVAGLVDQTHSLGLHFGSIESGALTFHANQAEVAAYRFSSADFERETALSLVEIYRKGGWRIGIGGAGYIGGLPALLSRHKVASDLLSAVVRNATVLQTVDPTVEQDIVLPAAWPAGHAPNVPGGLLSAVGLVVVETLEGQTATGTGFVISPGGYILTCYHVVEDAVRVSIKLEGSSQLRPVLPVKGDAASDMALLWISDRNGSEKWLALNGPSVAPALGDQVGLLGYPLGASLGLDVSYSQGIINSVRKVRDRNALQIDAGAAPGSSGAPVFDRTTGTVVGMLTSGLVTQAGMLINFATDIRAIWQLGWLRQPGE